MMDDPKFFDHTRESEDITSWAILAIGALTVVASIIGLAVAYVQWI